MTTCCFLPTWEDISVLIYTKPPIGREKDFDASTSSAAVVSLTKENHTGHSPHLQGLSDDDTRKRTAHGYKIPAGKARTALGEIL